MLQRPHNHSTYRISSLLPLHGRDFIRLAIQPHSRPISAEKSSKIMVEGEHWPNVRIAQKHEEERPPSTGNPPYFSPRFPVCKLIMEHPYMLYGAAVERTAAVVYLPNEPGVDVFLANASWAGLPLLFRSAGAQGPLDIFIDYNRDAYECAGVSRQQADLPSKEIESLKQTLLKTKQQSDENLKQHQSEIELLKQTLAATKMRLEESEGDARRSAALEQELEQLRKSLQQAEERSAGSAALKVEHEHILKRLAATEEALANTREQSEAFHQQSLVSQADVQQLQERLTEERAFNTGLQQSLTESQERLEQAQAGHQKREQELRTTLDETNLRAEQTAESLKSEIELLHRGQASLEQRLQENQLQLTQAEAEHKRRETQLQTSLNEANRSANESLARSEAEITTLRQQIQTQESSRQQLLQEKAELANRLQAEATRALSFAQHARSLDERIQNREREFDALQQEGNDTIANLKEALEQAKRTIDEVELCRQQQGETLQQVRFESEAQLERLNLTLEREKQQAKEEQSRLGAIIEDLRTQLETNRTKADIQQLELATQLEQTHQDVENLQRLLKTAEETVEIAKESLVETNRSADESLKLKEAEVAALRAQIKTQDSSLQQLQQEKMEFASCLQAETTRALEFAQQTQSLGESKQQLERELDRIQLTVKDAESQHLATIASLREELEQTRLNLDELGQSRQQVNEALQQLQAESETQQEQLKQALEAERQQTSEEQSRVAAVIEDLNVQLEAVRAKASHHRKKWIKLAALLQQKHLRSVHLKHLLKSAKEASENANKRLAEVELSQQELQNELQQEIEAAQAAWMKASESDIAMQVTKQELAALKAELEHEIILLRAQLEHQQEHSEAALSRHIAEKEKLQQSLEENRLALKAAGNTIRSLKSEQQTQRNTLFEYEMHFAQLEEKSRVKQAKLASAVESGLQEIASLQQKLDATNGPKTDSETLANLQRALQQAEDEIASLKRKIKGLYEVQQEMERQLNEGQDAEVIKLRSALETTEAKLKQAEKLIFQFDETQQETRH